MGQQLPNGLRLDAPQWPPLNISLYQDDVFGAAISTDRIPVPYLDDDTET
jgi:hypothetical protein